MGSQVSGMFKTTKYAEEVKAYKEAMKRVFVKGVVPKKEIPSSR